MWKPDDTKYDSIAIMIKVASLEFEKVSNQILSDDNLSNSQFRILKFLLRNMDVPIRQIDIEQYFSMTNPTVTGLLQSLEKKGMIERVSNPNDRRSKLIKPSAGVCELKPKLEELGNILENTFTQKLTDEEKVQMKVLLRKMLDK